MRIYGKSFGSFDYNGKQLDFAVTVRGKTYHFPERRVDGNPTMIESFEENGVHIKELFFDELNLDGEQAEVTEELKDEVLSYLEDNEDSIDWEWGYE